jgi:NADPH:quinone reductase-like Zn-dependent oxidoreductase
MRVYEIHGAFGLENLKQVERPEPGVGAGQVRLRVLANSLNARDLMTVLGTYNPKQKLPLVPLSDGVGEVVEVGAGVTRVKVGDRVAGTFAQAWLAGEPTREKLRQNLGGPLDGMLAEQVVLPADGVVPVPAHLTDAEAACLPCAGLTAWSALVGNQAGFKPGDTLLVQGTGGVSLFALQFAKLLGGRVIVTTSSDEKGARAKALGADEVINYKSTSDWDKAARALTGGVGVDQVIEVGGAGTMERSLRAVRFGGSISVIGVLSGTTGELSLIPVLMQNLRLQGVLVGHREGFEAMNRAVSQAKLRPVVDRVFPFDQAREAFAHLQSGAHFGKVCIGR